ncbi:unnamed protein product [Musa textilis]
MLLLDAFAFYKRDARFYLICRLGDMSMDASALLKHAAKAELRESEKILFGPQVFSTLDSLLLDIHAMLQPRPIDYEKRRLLIEEFNMMAVDRFGNNGGFPIVEAFGSFIMDLFTTTSDLDLSVNFSNSMNNFPRNEKISVLGKLSKVLYGHQRKGHVTGVLPIMGARVPVLKVVDCRTGVECDISVENKDGISRSLIFRFVSSIDERFRILCYLIKAWAKAHDINSSKDRTMNSLSIITLVAFHLQTRNPPILPPLCALLKDGTDMLSIERRVAGFKNFGIRNRESVAELFVSLLSKLSSVKHLWEHGLCASTCEGSWICKKTWESGVGNVTVEDFLDQSENFARSVGEAGMQKIYECIRGSLSDLSRFAMRQIDSPKLKELLFKSVDDLNAPKKERVPKVVVQHKRRYPFQDAGTSVKPMASKRPRHLEPTRAPDHARYQTPNAWPNPLAALQSQASSYGIHRAGLIFGPPQPAFTPFHHPVLLSELLMGHLPCNNTHLLLNSQSSPVLLTSVIRSVTNRIETTCFLAVTCTLSRSTRLLPALSFPGAFYRCLPVCIPYPHCFCPPHIAQPRFSPALPFLPPSCQSLPPPPPPPPLLFFSLSSPGRCRRHHRWIRGVGLRPSPTESAHVLVALPEPATSRQRFRSMADGAVVAGRTWRLRRRDRQLPGDWALGRQSTASEFDMAAQGRPSLCGQSGGHGIQFCGGREPLREE